MERPTFHVYFTAIVVATCLDICRVLYLCHVYFTCFLRVPYFPSVFLKTLPSIIFFAACFF
jgi:hypothetical protein